MTKVNPRRSCRIVRRADQQGTRSAMVVQDSPIVSEKFVRDLKDKILRCKHPMIFSTFNVRTLNSIKQISELTYNAVSLNIDLICIQEHRLFHDNLSLKYHSVGMGWTFISSSAWKNSINATIGGVGILISPRAMRCLNNIQKVSPRIIVASFQGNPCSTTISCYSPTNVSEEEQLVKFYDDLSSVMREIPKHNVLVICGDFKAHIGKNEANRFSFHNEANRNGQYLTDFALENKLQILNTKFMKKPGKLWTFTYPNDTKSQLHFILINRKWVNSVINCEAYHTFEGVNSDHRIVSANICLRLRANKIKLNKTPLYNWTYLAHDKNLQTQYTVEAKNRFQALQSETEINTPNSLYENFILAHNEAAAVHIPLKSKIKTRVPWENETVKHCRERVKETAKAKNAHHNLANETQFNIAKESLANTYQSEQKKYVESKIKDLKNCADNKQTSTAWQIVNEISGRKKSNRARLKAKDNDDRLNKWRTHFQNLLGNTPLTIDIPIQQIHQRLNIKLGEFTMDELKRPLSKLKSKKAPGLDNIPPEVWKYCNFDNILLGFCNNVYNGNSIDKWTEGCILPFPKKGDLGVTDNYRGITLTAIAAKIYNSMLLNRIQPTLEKILRKNQNGFRKNRSTTGQILTVRRIIEGVKDQNIPAVLLFVDFSKAFDSIHRPKMQKILLAYGLPEEIVHAIMMMYRNTKAKVRSPDGDTTFFEILAGVLQGDTLAPFIFILCLDYALRTSIDPLNNLGLTLHKKKSSRYPSIHLTDADYADDLALLADSISGATQLLHSLEQSAKNIGLYVNTKKTEFIAYNCNGNISNISGNNLNCVDSFVYLGSSIASTETDIKTRLGKAWSALTKLNSIWKSNLTEKLKKEFFQAVVQSVLLYGSTTWTLTKQLEKKIDGNYTRMLRAILNISWKEHPSKERLYGTFPPISQVIREQRLRFVGHCWRSKDEIVQSVLLWRPNHGKRNRGRPSKTYIHQLIEDTGMNVEDLPNAMENRELWRRRIKEIRASSTR